MWTCSGTIRWTNGNKFEGEFVNNAKSGFGVYRWSDGATYSGSWEADDRSCVMVSWFCCCWLCCRCCTTNVIASSGGEAVTAWANGMSYTGRYGRVRDWLVVRARACVCVSVTDCLSWCRICATERACCGGPTTTRSRARGVTAAVSAKVMRLHYIVFLRLCVN